MTLNLSGIWSGALTGPHSSYIVLPILSNRQNTRGHKGQMVTYESPTKQSIFVKCFPL